MILFQGAKRTLWKPFTVQVGSIEIRLRMLTLLVEPYAFFFVGEKLSNTGSFTLIILLSM